MCRKENNTRNSPQKNRRTNKQINIKEGFNKLIDYNKSNKNEWISNNSNIQCGITK